ncbi:MAG: nitrate ABC transporter substrate-binding protein, partial [Xanthobacteraceae bacterium]
MSTFDDQFDPNRPFSQSGCRCGRHRSGIEHDADTARTVQCVPAASEDQRYESVVAAAVMRAILPKDAARRAFVKSLGASTALAALSQVFPLKTATEV